MSSNVKNTILSISIENNYNTKLAFNAIYTSKQYIECGLKPYNITVGWTYYYSMKDFIHTKN